MQKTKSRQRLSVIVVNGIIMALYLALTILVAPVSSGPIQFRISESLNHLVVFNRKLLWGVLGGVIVYNAFFGFGIMDVVFGGGQTLLSLGLTALLQNKVKNVKMRLVLNTIFFTISMGLIAYMLVPTGGQAFWTTYGTLALSEFIVMAVSAPLMYYLDRALDFEKRVYIN
ncbi:QueT transporter family protein [Enterococcus faecium]|nr:QueT transporter family protein [Enterococcus faecium]PQE89352.1 QueT transporter family protein [Enterococcus faecium]